MRIALIGFGTVGQGLAEILLQKQKILKDRYNFDFSLVAITDVIKGSIYNEKGLDLNKILSLIKEGKKIDEYPEGIKGWDGLRVAGDSNADVIVEVTPTDIKTAEPATSYITTALENRKHVVTTNKGPVALFYHRLAKLAQEKGVFFRFEGTVLSGTPVFSLCQHALAGVEIKQIRGILNGTTNYILTEMEKGKSYEQALKTAQQLGYAEAVPDADVEGWDATAKVVILANVLMDGHLSIQEVKREGITKITSQDVQRAQQEGKRWKLIGHISKENGSLRASVLPEKLPQGDFLAQVSGVTNALTIETDLLGSLTIVGPGAGRRETGFSLLSDLLEINRLLS